MILASLSATFAAGCGSDLRPETYEPDESRGKVDQLLAKDVQEKQQVLIDVFELLRRETEFSNLDIIRRTKFKETEDEFYGEQAIKELSSWDWDGPPNGDDFPVKLVFRKEDTEAQRFEEVEVTRVYTVTKDDRDFTITRKK